MHYKATDFGKNTRKPVIIRKKNDESGEQVKMGQRNYLSEGDKLQVNLAYRCSDKKF